MNIEIVSPTKAKINFTSASEEESVKKFLTYRNTSVQFQLKKHRSNTWWRQRDPGGWNHREQQLLRDLHSCLLDNSDHIRPGIIPYLQNKFSVNLTNKVKYPDFKKLAWKKKPEFEPYPYQANAVKQLMKIKHGNISLPTGCHSKGTKIMMYDGTLKNVEDIVVGDVVMGPDSKPRNVLRLVSGEEEMYRITPNLGEPFCVNKSHILSLKCTGLKKQPKYRCQDIKGSVVNISVEEYLKTSNYFKHIYKLYRVGIDNFNRRKKELPIDPYLFGLWLGDGDSHNFSITNIDNEITEYLTNFAKSENLYLRVRDLKHTISNYDINKSKGTSGNKFNLTLKELEVFNNKHIPDIYKFSSVENRRKILAGLLDSDGYNHRSCFEISQKNKRLFDDIVFVARSLGFGVSQKEEFKCSTNTKNKIERKYYRANIRGDFTNIPTKIKRKQVEECKLNRDPLVTGFKVEAVGTDKYYGFTVDSDNLYVMGDFTVTHNCGKSFILLNLAREMGLKTVVVTPSKSIFNELLKEFQERLGKKAVGGYGDGKKEYKKTVTIAIGRSMTMLKPGSEAYKALSQADVLLVDESHTFAANELEKVCHGIFEDVPYRMFVSATQTRGDGTEKLLYSIIGKNVLDMDLKSAIDQGFLCPLEFTIIKTFSPSTRNKKDPLECKREHFLYNPEIAKIAAKIANASARAANKSTLILVEELRQIEALSQLLEVPFGYVHSGSKSEAALWNLEKVNLQEQVDAFNNGDIKVLIGTRAIATGTNIYPTHNTINFVGGSSEIVTKQGTMGRSTRKLEISKFKDKHPPKEKSMIYDFEVVNEPTLDRQLNTRIGYYSESGGSIKKINYGK